MSKEFSGPETDVLTALSVYAPRVTTERSPFDDRPVHEPTHGTRADRRHERIPLAIEVSLTSPRSFHTGMANDISEGGIFVATHIAPDIGEVVQIFIELGTPRDRKVLTLTGQVTWIRVPSSEGLPPGCGIKFVKPTAEQVEVIRSYIKRRTG